MIRNLPFTTLRSFESAARLGSISRAAEELNVTQSAISQQVKALEEWTGCSLLHRSRSGSKPTSDGAALASAIANGLGQISDLCTRMQSHKRQNEPIIVSALPGFAVNWLFPRLIRFDQHHPDMPVSIHTNTSGGDLVAGKCDLSIQYGHGNYRGMHVEKLMLETLTPVCAPSLIAKGGAISTVDDLARQTLLVDEISDYGGELPTWSFWAGSAGLQMPKPRNTRRFGQSSMVVQAAIEGYGVALGRSPLVQAALADGRLIAPLPFAVPSPYAYWIVCAKNALQADGIRQFRDWLLQEVALTGGTELINPS